MSTTHFAFLSLILLIPFVFCQNPFGQIILAYYSGVSLDTVGSGGLNALSLAFFSPDAMTSATCDFTDPSTSCLKPAAGAGPSLGLSWALNVISTSLSGLSSNTSPHPGGTPTIFFAFGGQSEGGAAWDRIFGDASLSTLFAQHCAQLVVSVTQKFSQKVYIGIDLDIEGTTTTLPHFPDFIKTFRGMASASMYPVMIDALSGLASNQSSDHYKLGIFKSYGPSAGGVTFLNMMVNNVQSSCDTMSGFWRSPALDFLQPSNRVLGFWGENLAAWILQNPGCTDGSDPLYPWMKKEGAGMGIWQWWLGSTNDITSVINQVRQ